FFFQAEDGIRDRNVTGVQTCALPISTAHRLLEGGFRLIAKGAPDVLIARCTQLLQGGEIRALTGAMKAKLLSDNSRLAERALREIGRASCRERGGSAGGAAALHKERW